MMKYLIICSALLTTLITPSYGFWGNTHEEIARSAIKERKILLNNEINKIGLDSGIDELFRDGDVNFIIRSGAITEDNGTRFRNHFYNPLDGSGLDDVFTGFSSYEWADQIYSGWSWRNSRQSFYLGLTAPSDLERRSALAKSFRALGQVMHLVQDKAVPAHVRNDLHMIPDGFEAYASENVNSLDFVPIAFSGPKNSLSPHAPRQLWDSDRYDGSNPSISAAIGLAEYTNANFASEDTIFTESYLDDWTPLNNKHYFPYPRQADMVVLDESLNRIGMNGYSIYRKYFDKIGGGQTIRHFATVSRLYEHLLDDPEPSIQGFDDQCYKDYADLLIPRAVGYSAALLDYFFRGQIDMVADPVNAGKYVIKNESTDEMDGTFSLYYDDTYDNRRMVAGAEWENMHIAAGGNSTPVTFTAPSDAKVSGKYMLVFQGTQGVEDGAVVGKSLVLEDGLDIRFVTVSNYFTNYGDRRGEIRLTTKNGIITGRIPLDMFNKVIKVRFDKNNPNIIGILVNAKVNHKNYFIIYKFSVDENNHLINYIAPIFEQPATVEIYNSSQLIDKDEEINPTYKYIWEWSIDSNSYSYFTIIDFYLDGEELKPFYGVNTSTYEYYGVKEYNCIGNNFTCSLEYSDIFDYGLMDETNEIYYGNNKVASSHYLCSDGGLQDNGHYLGCTENYASRRSVYPLAIFNKNDFAYISTNYDYNWKPSSSIITTPPLDLSNYIDPANIFTSLYGKGSSFNNLLLKDNAYSFSMTRNWNTVSFSSSLGILNCGIMATDHRVDDGYLVIKGNYFGVSNGCNDFHKINAPTFAFGDQEVHDLYVR